MYTVLTTACAVGLVSLGGCLGDPPALRDSSAEPDTVAGEGQPGDVQGSDTEPDTAAGDEALDLDRDGHSELTDCDDREPRAHPGALEVWDGLDNDCDGRVDGRGDYVGAHRLVATAIIEGQTRRTEVDCDVRLRRLASVISYAIDCDVPSDDALAVQLLGEVLTVSPVDNVASEGAWTGGVLIDSSAAWSASGSGSARWSETLDQITLTTRLDTSSLTLRGGGELRWEPPATGPE